METQKENEQCPGTHKGAHCRGVRVAYSVLVCVCVGVCLCVFVCVCWVSVSMYVHICTQLLFVS